MSFLLPRRGFLGLLVALPGAALLRWTPAQGAVNGSRMLFVYEAGLSESVWLPVARRYAPLEVRPIEGDRVRFARALLAAAPQSIGGLTRHADLLLLVGTAEEAGFRVVEQSVSRPTGQPALVLWRMQHRRAVARPCADAFSA
jgi:hypothetical protein